MKTDKKKINQQTINPSSRKSIPLKGFSEVEPPSKNAGTTLQQVVFEKFRRNLII